MLNGVKSLTKVNGSQGAGPRRAKTPGFGGWTAPFPSSRVIFRAARPYCVLSLLFSTFCAALIVYIVYIIRKFLSQSS